MPGVDDYFRKQGRAVASRASLYAIGDSSCPQMARDHIRSAGKQALKPCRLAATNNIQTT
jgi:hypothetical protein